MFCEIFAGRPNWAEGLAAVFGLLTVVTTVVGVAIAYAEWRKNRKIQRSKFLQELLRGFRQSVVQGVFYKVDDERAGKHWLDDVYANIAKERDVDRALLYFSYLSYLRLTGLVTEDEFSFFDYQIRSVLSHEGVQSYLKKVSSVSERLGAKMPFYHLLRYGRRFLQPV